MRRLIRALIKVKPIRPVFDTGDLEFDTQLARLLVLYEDLKVESGGWAAERIPEMDEISRDYRQLYFVRRSFATIFEMASSFRTIDCTATMRLLKSGFDTDQAGEWREAVLFFQNQQNQLRITDERHLYGGHFQTKAARYAIQHMHPDKVGTFEIRVSHADQPPTIRFVFKFVAEVVGVAMTANRSNKDVRSFIAESFDTLTDAMKHATAAVQLLGEVVVFKKFGVNP